MDKITDDLAAALRNIREKARHLPDDKEACRAAIAKAGAA